MRFDFLRRLKVATRVAYRTFKIRMYGQYVCNNWDGKADYVEHKYKGSTYYTPTYCEDKEQVR